MIIFPIHAKAKNRFKKIADGYLGIIIQQIQRFKADYRLEATICSIHSCLDHVKYV